ncbi:hypothetical protein [Thermoanaerobacterium thermosaccharolyticum]|uniref:hypothetical protein n=1 Tax=Thermoanaerobacterium thermosaccharolyticum TaxID=1517 RepID=UPI003DA99471
MILFHEKVIKETGGSAGIRDRRLIDSALNKAFMTYDGKDLYPSIIEKIAVIAHSFISNRRTKYFSKKTFMFKISVKLKA